MQTFIPYPSFELSAAVMDLSRLGKQIIEAQQIFKALTQENYGWKNHPATKMWGGYESALVAYAKAFNAEWYRRRGKDHGAWLNLEKLARKAGVDPSTKNLPFWWGDSRVHDTHKSNLLRKDREHYARFIGVVSDDLDYYWPK